MARFYRVSVYRESAADCSGGNGHVDFADIEAVRMAEGERPKVLAQTRFPLGRY